MDSTLKAMTSIEGAKFGDEFQKAAGDIELARRAIDSLNKDIEDLGNNDGAKEQSNKFTELNSAIMLVQRAYSGISRVVGEFTELGKEQTRTQINLATVLANQGASLEDYDRIMAAIDEQVAKTTLTSQEFTAALAEISTYASDTDALIAAIPVFADFAIGMNEGSAELGVSAATQYATAFGKVLDGLYDGFTKKGFTFTEAQKEILTGAYSDLEKVQVIVDVVGESWADLAENIAMTDEGKIVQLTNSTDKLKAEIGEGLLPYVAKFQEMVANVLNPALEFLANNLDIIVPIVTTFGIAIGIAAAAWGIYTIQQWAANAALLAFPATWIVLALVAVVAAIAAVISKMGGLRITWLTVVNAVLTLVEKMKLGFMKASDALDTVVDNMHVSVMSGLESMLNGAINLINKFINALNKIPGVSISAVDQLSFAASAALAAEARQGARADALVDLENEISLNQTNREAEIAALREANEPEETLVEQILGNSSATADATEGLADAVTGSGSSAALKTTSDDELLKDDDIKLLKDIATREYGVYFQTVEPQINLNDMIIQETANADTVMEIIVTKIGEAADASLVVA